MSMHLTLLQLFDRFPDDTAAERWLVRKRWPNGGRCPSCDSDDVQARPTRKPQLYRYRAYRRDFSVKTATIMHGSYLGCHVWVIALYLPASRTKNVSSLQLHRDLGISYKAAWHLSHRIRGASTYRGLSDYRHASVHHGGGEYGLGPVHTNGIESFWALFKRGFRGTYHSMSPKHLHRYAREFEGHHITTRSTAPCSTWPASCRVWRASGIPTGN